MTLDERINYISGAIVNFASLDGVFNIKPLPRLGLPEIFGNDGTIGILGQGFPPGTRYPAGPLLASTWNADRAIEEGIAQGREARARGPPSRDTLSLCFFGRDLSPSRRLGE
jgi:beta-glucosidase